MRRLTLIAMALFLVIAVSIDANAAKKPEHVIVVGFDGWGAYSVPKAEMPNLSELMSRGAWTLKKRSVLPSSSAINWASMFMGVGTEGHGYTQWGSKTPEIPSIALSENGIFPTIFTITRQQKPKAEIGVLYEWDGIKHLIDTLAVSHHAQVSPTPDGSSAPITKAFVDYIITSKPTLALVSYDNPDAVGHRVGHDTPEY
ncbi:MAG: alkaline phosphatase, partial [Muribaculaceae bacterium]|nr:alkaline phosphatase [Muribaculaceae bacterium]